VSTVDLLACSTHCQARQVCRVTYVGIKVAIRTDRNKPFRARMHANLTALAGRWSELRYIGPPILARFRQAICNEANTHYNGLPNRPKHQKLRQTLISGRSTLSRTIDPAQVLRRTRPQNGQNPMQAGRTTLDGRIRRTPLGGGGGRGSILSTDIPPVPTQ